MDFIYNATLFLALVISLSRHSWAGPRTYTFNFMGEVQTIKLSCDLNQIPSHPPIVLSGEEHDHPFAPTNRKMAERERNIFQKWVDQGDLRMGKEGKYEKNQVSQGQFPLEDSLIYASTVTLMDCQTMKESLKGLRRFQRSLQDYDEESYFISSEPLFQNLLGHLRPIRDGYLTLFKRMTINGHVKDYFEKVEGKKMLSLQDDFTAHQSYPHWLNLFPPKESDLTVWKEKVRQIENSARIIEGQCFDLAKDLIGKTSGGQKKIFETILGNMETKTVDQVDLDKAVLDIRNQIFVEKILEQYCQDANSGKPRPVVAVVGLMHLWGMYHLFNLVDPENKIPVRMRIYGTSPHQTLLRENGIQEGDHPLFTTNILRAQGVDCSHSTNAHLNRFSDVLSDLQKTLNHVTLEEAESDGPLVEDFETRALWISQKFNDEFFNQMSKDFFDNFRKSDFDTMYTMAQKMLKDYLNSLPTDGQPYKGLPDHLEIFSLSLTPLK